MQRIFILLLLICSACAGGGQDSAPAHLTDTLAGSPFGGNFGENGLGGGPDLPPQMPDLGGDPIDYPLGCVFVSSPLKPTQCNTKSMVNLIVDFPNGFLDKRMPQAVVETCENETLDRDAPESNVRVWQCGVHVHSLWEAWSESKLFSVTCTEAHPANCPDHQPDLPI